MKRTSKYPVIILAGLILMSVTKMASADEIVMATWGGGVGEAWRQAFAKPFFDKTGIAVKIVEVPTPEAQIRAQKDAPQFNAAIASLFEAVQMYQDGLLEDFNAKDIAEIKNVPAKYILRAPNGKIIGATTYFAYYGIAFNADLAKPTDFSSWKNLADPKWKNKIAITRPVYSSTYDLVMLSIAAGGDEKNIKGGLELLAGVAKNAVVMYSSMAQMNQLLQRGEVAAAPYYSTRVWQMNREGMKNIQMAIPSEGALMLPYIVVVPKGSKDRGAALKWLNYVAQPEGQQRIADIAGYLPLNSNARLSADAEKNLGMPLSVLMAKLYQPDWSLIAQKRKERLEAVEKIMAQPR